MKKDRLRQTPRSPAAALLKAAFSIAVACTLVACGGSSGTGVESSGVSPLSETRADLPSSRSEAARFLTQATFGPTDADTDRVMALGYTAWVNEQFGKPATSHRSTWEAADAAAKAVNANNGVWQDGVINSFWKQALTADDQLRGRVAFALSQIFVISMQDSAVGENPRAVAAYLDMLGDKGFGNYRELLESVAMHPMMASYLTAIRNQKADGKGRVPDENFAREIVQLMSMGLHMLNLDGSVQQSNGVAVEAYTPADISGLAKVFTGWSWDCPDGPDNSCFFWGSVNSVYDPDRTFKSLLGYAQYHSAEEKTFLGTTIAKQSRADPYASLKVALDTLHNHPNVGPFIGRQLIQRLVTSNPSPQYVAAVAASFNNNGSGVRGDLKAVIRTVLTHAEARSVSNTSGKLREPVLRLSAFLRAFPLTSDTGDFKVGNTDNQGNALGQTVLRSPSVFNFYRPGYVPPGTQAAARGLAVPELQLVQETTASGYVNYMRDNVSSGVGSWNGTVNGTVFNRRDLQISYASEVALADKPSELLDRLNARLMYGSMPAALKAEIQGAVEKMAIPALNTTASNQKHVDDAKRNRVNAALFLTLVSPEYQTQK